MINYQLTFEKATPTGKLFDQRFWLNSIQAVKTDIVQGIENQRQLDGSAYQPLKIDTIARKMAPHIIDHPGPKAIATSKMLTAKQLKYARGYKRIKVAKQTEHEEEFEYIKSTTQRGVSVSMAKKQVRYISSQPSKRLIDGGNMQYTGTLKATEDYGELTPGVQRVDVIYSQQEAPTGGNVATRFWGVSIKAATTIHKLAEIALDKWLRSTKK